MAQQDTAQVVEELTAFLPDALIASSAGVQDADVVQKWRTGDLEPEEASAARLRFLLDQAHLIASRESQPVASAWLTSSNAHLAGDLPVKAIREDRFKEVAVAAGAFMNGYAG